MIWVSGGYSVGGEQGCFINHHSNYTEFSRFDNLQQVRVELGSFFLILQDFEYLAPVDDVFTMQNNWIVGMMMKMAFLEIFQCFMKLYVIWILKPASQQAEKTMGSFCCFSKYMIARFVQIQTKAIFKL